MQRNNSRKWELFFLKKNITEKDKKITPAMGSYFFNYLISCKDSRQRLMDPW